MKYLAEFISLLPSRIMRALLGLVIIGLFMGIVYAYSPAGPQMREWMIEASEHLPEGFPEIPGLPTAAPAPSSDPAAPSTAAPSAAVTSTAGPASSAPANAAPASPGSSAAVVGDYYTITGTAVVERTPVSGQVTTCDLDSLGRAQCAYGLLTAPAKGDSEGKLPDPAGWPKNNAKVTILASDGVDGSKQYKGWMMNRSHLIADSLGGPEVAGNLVTGTRTQNVGTTQIGGQYAGGMAHTERMAREYLASGKGAECPLYYAATPNYTGSELLPRTVTVDIMSCDHAIDERVIVSNTANGWNIDYMTGAVIPTR
ncbi:DNA/RNA non-specific endonuclease [Brachybacterium sp. JHP9]|uniref:DNA/RNA non-specific endonuclease n=1 Tax=Brachybacterium equifaecis TaxID=2910770 RepID=A0ABT0R539_9MICO|nr:DNA/RNA non-specific endonuclease [Brachybacterium equifaecis]MCL6424369.1 DNA/RNA non-specific endonuclease [Brachybacterium equifaecis]